MTERGETNVSLRTFNRLARALGVTLVEMFEEMDRGSDSSEN